MTTLIDCPYLGSQVELTEERERHIAESHPDLLPEHRAKIWDALQAPDSVRKSHRFASARLFTKYFKDLRGGIYERGALSLG